MLKINGKPLEAKHFAYDGCHKIYLCFDTDEVIELAEMGYEILPAFKLPEIWEETCFLRFISRADLVGKDYVEQGDEDAVIEYEDDAADALGLDADDIAAVKAHLDGE